MPSHCTGPVPTLLVHGITQAAPVVADSEEKKATTEKPITEMKDLKKATNPDETVLKEKIQVEDDQILALQERLTAIKQNLDSRDTGRGETNSELSATKSKFNESRAESRRLQQVTNSTGQGHLHRSLRCYSLKSGFSVAPLPCRVCGPAAIALSLSC